MTLINLKTYQLAILFLLNTVILVASIKIIIEVANTNIHSKYFVKGVLIFLLSFYRCRFWQRLEQESSTWQKFS